MKTKEQELEVINFYLEGNSSLKISKLTKISKPTIFDILKRNNIEIRKNERNKKYHFNESYFEIIDTPAKAYFLGLFVSDGSITNKSCSISLQDGDEHILIQLMKEIGFKGNLYTVVDNRKESYKDKKVMSLYSQKMIKDLAKYGVTSTKSHSTYFPEISEEFWSHFIRGVFDGDGCICLHKSGLKFSITGNDLLIKRIQEILIEKCGISKTKLYNDPKHPKNIVTMQNSISKIYNIIHDYLYFNSNTFYIKRKKEKFRKWNSFA